jgi:serine/threonine protein kinase/Tfp pilus assembly protein PilF
MGIMASHQQSVEQLFADALERAPADRPIFLDRACAGMPGLRLHVEELLRADERAGSFLDKPLLMPGADQSYTERPATPTSAVSTALNVFDPTTGGRFKPGQVIADRFAVNRFIARGGMGEVYEVEDSFLQGVHVALKMILPQIAGDSSSSHRFEQEVLLARKVTHANLCPIYDISRCQEPPPPFLFLTMKLLSGETLASRLHRPPLIPRAEAISIFRQMIAGLSALHEAGVIHRDIKPNNVMLDHSGSELCLSIMDFGLAHLYDSQTTVLTRGFIAGTPGYVAPELLRGDSPSQATDIFALGVLFQQVLIGDPPSAGPHGLSTRPSPALDAADVPPIFIHSVKEFLSEDPTLRRRAFQQLQFFFNSGGSANAWTPTDTSDDAAHRILTRRNFVVGSALTACAAAGGAVWKWDRVDYFFHPIPEKRFVALMAWPAVPNDSAPIVSTVLNSIRSRLARAEAYVKNLLIISSSDVASSGSPMTPAESLNGLDANLVLAASLHSTTKTVTLLLQVLDAETQRQLRRHRISCRRVELSSLSDKGSAAAARLLGLPDQDKTTKDTDELRGISAAGFSSFSQAEQLASQPNNTGLDAAILKYGECLGIEPRFHLGYAKLAIAYIRKYHLYRDTAILELARQNAEKADSNSNSAEGLLSRALVYLYAGDTNEAMVYFAKALKADTGNPEIMLYRAQALRNLNRWPEAEQTYREILKERPNYWPANNELGWILFRQAKYQQAADAFDAAAMAAPNVAMPLANLGSMYLELGKHEEAIDASERSIKRSPNETAYRNLGDMAFSDGNYKIALANYQQAATLDPKYHNVWRDIGDCYAMLGQPALVRTNYVKAAHLLSEELRDNPRNGPRWMTLAFYHAKIGDAASAATDIENAERRGAGDVESQFMKVQALALLGKKEDATKLLLACMDRGLSTVEVDFALDLKDIRKDPRYLSRAAKKHPTTGPAAS